MTSHLVGDEPEGFVSLALQESAKEALRRMLVPTGLDENVDHVAVLIDRTPQIMSLSTDRDEQLIEMSDIAEPALSLLQPLGVGWAELAAALPDGLIGDGDTAFGEQIFDVPEAQTETVVEPDGVADDFWRISVTTVSSRKGVHPGIVPEPRLT